MIIQCDKCSTKFKIDEAKITGKGIRVRCTKCQNVFAVAPLTPPAPEPTPEVDESVAQSQGAGTGAGEGAGFGADTGFDNTGAGAEAGAGDTGFTGFDAPVPQDMASQPSFSEQAFDFGTPPEGGFDAPEGGQPAPGGADAWAVGGGEGFDAGGVSGVPDADAGEHHEDAFGAGGFDAGGESQAFGGDDAGAPPPQEEPFMQPPPPTPPIGDDWQVGKADDEGAGEEKPQTEFGDETSADDEGPSADSNGADGGMPSEPKPELPHAAMSDKEFAAALSESTEDEHKAVVAEDKASAKAVGPSSKATSSKLIPIVIIALLIILTGAWYFGLRGKQEPVVAAPSVEIAAIEGRYVESKNLGSFFVIEAKIKNVTAVPQSVKGVTGVLYDAKGAKLAFAPGRVISSDDINNLTQEDIVKGVKPGSVGVIPAKGTLPIVVIFMETPPGMSEFGIDILP